MNPRGFSDLSAQEPPVFESQPARVVLFEDRALVVRRASIALSDAGPRTVAISGLSALIDERTVQARVLSGEARISSVSVKRRVVADESPAEAAFSALKQELDEARAQSVEAQRALDRAKRMEARVSLLASKWIEALANVPLGLCRPERLQEWKAAIEALDREADAALDACVSGHRATMLADDHLEQADIRVRELSLQTPRYEALLHLQVEGLGSESNFCALEISYQVPCALWRPEHWARLSLQGQKAAMELVTWATAWQCTGENWTEIELWFSTARPAQRTQVPLVRDDVLVSRRKSERERRRVRVSARESVAHGARDFLGRESDEMPGVDDGGEPLSFKAKGRISFLSNGRPIRIELSRRSMPAVVERVLYPEVSEAAHFRAEAVLTQAELGPILAGPLRVCRDLCMVGRSSLGFVGVGEHFCIGFGVDEGIRVRRCVDEARETAAVLGTQKIRRTIRLYLSNLSDEPKSVVVVERIFVSETEDVEVNTLELSAFQVDKRDGFARAELFLEPLGTLALKLAYEIRASSSVVLSF